MNEPTYCKSCGAYIPDGQEKCLACGFPIEIPPLTDSEFEYRREHSAWKRITKYDENGNEVNERGEVLSVPDPYAIKTIEEFKKTCYAAQDKYSRKAKVDIDLDKLLKQEFFTVKIGGKVKWFYFGKADMEIGSTIYHTKDLFGHISINHNEKQKFHMVMIER